MKQFSKLYSDFWTNYDNVEIADLGTEVQLMALYLQSNSHHNMFGVYYLPLLYISSDLKLSVKRVQTALTKLCKINYCKYDEKTKYVWVCNLVFEQVGEEVDLKDNRIKAIQSIWKSLPSKLELLEEIYQKYGTVFHLEERCFKKSSEVCDKNSVKDEMAVTDVSSDITTNKNVDISVSKDINAAMDSDIGVNVQPVTNSFPLVVSLFESPLKEFIFPFEGCLKPLVSPFKGASEPLRSNIEDRIENIEGRSKKEEVDKEIEKEKRKDLYKNNVPISNIVAQARLCVDEKPPDKNFISSEKTKAVVCLNSKPRTELELKAKLKLKSKQKKEAKNSIDDSIAEVFEHWKSKMDHPISKLDRKRKVLIQNALQLGYSIQQLCDAITGCSLTGHNTGQNDQGQRYDGLHVIFRDADQIDRFIYNFHHPPKPYTKAHQRLHDNLHVADDWVKNKLNKSAGNGRNSYA